MRTLIDPNVFKLLWGLQFGVEVTTFLVSFTVSRNKLKSLFGLMMAFLILFAFWGFDGSSAVLGCCGCVQNPERKSIDVKLKLPQASRKQLRRRKAVLPAQHLI
jgi:hypothetical protein